MTPQTVPRPGDVVLATVQYTDTSEVKSRPALVLFSNRGNLVVAGITSNTRMEGVPLTREDGALKDSVIKLNYIFTISQAMASKVLFRLGPAKRREVADELERMLGGLRE